MEAIKSEVIRDTMGGYLKIQHFNITELIDKEQYVDPKAVSFFKVKQHVEDGKESFTSIPYTLQDVYDSLDAKCITSEKAGYVCTLQEYREVRLKELWKILPNARREMEACQRRLKRVANNLDYIQDTIKIDEEKLGIKNKHYKLTNKSLPDIS